MKFPIVLIAALLLVSCAGKIGSARLVLSEPNDTASVSTLTRSHELQITESRMLVYNGEEQFAVPEGQIVVFEVEGTDEPVFTLLNKRGRQFNWSWDF